MSDITIGALSLPGFNPANLGADVALTGLTVALSNDQVTGSNVFPQRIVGMGGFKITLPDGVFNVESVESRSALTLTVAYTGSSGTVSGTLHKYAELRIYALSSFTPSGSVEVVQQGSPGSTAWYRRYGASVIHDGQQNVLHLPEIILPATINSSNPFARYFAGLYTIGGVLIRPFLEFQLSQSITPTSWAQIIEFNTPPSPPPPGPDNFYTAREIDARFPSGSANQLVYYKQTGNVFTPLTLDAAFTISSDTLFLAGPSGVNRIQEEGANLPQRQTLNFVGSSATAADDTTRTTVTFDSDLNAIASNASNGLYARTGAGTVAARTITGPAAGITVTNGDGVAGNPTLALANNLAALEAISTTGLIAQTGADTVLPRTITGTANKIGVTNGDGVAGNPTLNIGSDVVTLTDTQTLTNKTLTSPRVGVALLDTSGNEVLETPATASAVNQLRATNSATGNPVSISAVGDDANIGLTEATKGTGNFVIQTNSIDRVIVHGNAADTYYGDGITSATPDNYTINGTGGSGTNIAGAHLFLAPGKGTGNAVQARLGVKLPLTTASGTSLQSLSSSDFPIVVNMFTNTSGVDVQNTTTETSIFGNASPGASRIIEAGMAKVGQVYRVKLIGTFGTTASPTMTIRIKFGSTTLITLGPQTIVPASGLFEITFDVWVTVVGASGQVVIQYARLDYTNATSGVMTIVQVAASAIPTVDFTVAQTFDVTAQWGTASASNNWQTRIDRIDLHR